MRFICVTVAGKNHLGRFGTRFQRDRLLRDTELSLSFALSSRLRLRTRKPERVFRNCPLKSIPISRMKGLRNNVASLRSIDRSACWSNARVKLVISKLTFEASSLKRSADFVRRRRRDLRRMKKSAEGNPIEKTNV